MRRVCLSSDLSIDILTIDIFTIDIFTIAFSRLLFTAFDERLTKHQIIFV